MAADAFAPSCHSVSGYADLYDCERCGTVQQPDLPGGAALHALYRAPAAAQRLALAGAR